MCCIFDVGTNSVSVFVSLSVQLCGPCHAGHHHLHLLPAEVLRVLHQPARASPPAPAVRVRWQPWVRHRVPNVRGKVGDTPWTLVFVPPQLVDHTAHVPRLLRVQDPQHRLRGPHQREPLHRDQRQRGHLRAGALHRQREFHRESSCAGLSISGSRGQCLIMIHASVESHHPELCPVSSSLFLGFLFLIFLSSNFPFPSTRSFILLSAHMLLFRSFFTFRLCFPLLVPSLAGATPSGGSYQHLCQCHMLFSLNSVPLALKVPWDSSLVFSLACCGAPSP